MQELKNIDAIINEQINNSLINSNLNAYKNYILLQKFNLSLDEAKLLCQKYCYNLDNVSATKNTGILNVLKYIKQIVLENEINNVTRLVKNIKPINLEYPNYQTLCQNLYEEEFNKTLFNPKNYDKKIIDGVEIIDAGIEFNIICRADGAFDGNNELTDNYYNRWNKPSRETYSFSNSHVSNSRLLMYALQSENKLVTYGFSDLPQNSIVENALGDNTTLATRKQTIDPRSFKDRKKIYPHSFDSCGQRFMSFNDIINHSSRNIHTEITLERFYYDVNGKEKRLQPSYIVYTKLNDNYLDDELYKESLKAAKEFSVPLVIIDLKKVLESEKNKINKLMNQEISIENAIEIIQLYSNNCYVV